ncbi:zinc ABC transporter substrate-binding protein [Nitrososphaera sp.]|uniref:metal ABC transporter solute-binding protein, Zn/Mn family n=1 Tax=Nitrososphaera sp. TaxID=1971748 RepID=UPI00307E0D62
MKQRDAALVAIAVVVPLAMLATVYTGARPGQQEGDGSNNGRLRVVASFYPLYDFASHVAGDRAEVSSLIPPGIEPHDWEPSPGDINRARSADLLVINGAGFESWTGGIEAKRVVNTGQAAFANAENKEDPHIWLDPVLAKGQVAAIASALAEADPANAQYYLKNAAGYAARLDALDSSIKSGLANCEKSDFIAFHDAFGRFAERYGLRQHPVQGMSPEGEVLPQQVQQAVVLANELGIDTIYSEELVDSRLAEVIAAEIPGGRVLVLSPVEGIDREELAQGVGYVEKMEANVSALKEGLQCAQ